VTHSSAASQDADDIWYDCATTPEYWSELNETDYSRLTRLTQNPCPATDDEITQLRDLSRPTPANVCATKARRRAAKPGSKGTRSKQQSTHNTMLPPQVTTPLPDAKIDYTDTAIPSIQPEDYESDPYLKNIYLYLTRGQLTNSDREDRMTLLLSEDFLVDENGILYRISLPRGKKASRVQSTKIRLAIPQIYLA
jgi:hypothetical protein